jgi:replicative DNA helicase
MPSEIQQKKLDIYGESFQLFLIKAIIEDASFYRSIRDYLKSSFISIEYIKTIYESIEKHFEKYACVPTYNNIESIIKTNLANQIYERDVCLKSISYIKDDSTFKDEAFIKEKTIAFCKTQAVLSATEKSIEKVEYYNSHPEKDPDFSDIIEQWNAVNKIEIDRVDDDIIENFEEYFKEEKTRRFVVPSGWPLYDYLLNGGFAAGEVHTIAAYLGSGKSTSCVNVGAEAFIQGKKVLHFAFENPVVDTYYGRISRVPIRSVHNYKDLVKKRLNEVQNKNGGKLYMKHYPMIRHSVATLESYCERLKDEKNIIPDLIIVDSPLHLLPSLKRDSERESVGIIWKDMKAFAQMINRPVVVTAQLNRDAKLSQKEVVGSENLATSIDIGRDSDSVLTITRSDEEKMAGIGNFFLTKNRFGDDSVKWKMLFKGSFGLIEEDTNNTNPLLSQLQLADTFKIESEDKFNDHPDAF